MLEIQPAEKQGIIESPPQPQMKCGYYGNLKNPTSMCPRKIWCGYCGMRGHAFVDCCRIRMRDKEAERNIVAL